MGPLRGLELVTAEHQFVQNKVLDSNLPWYDGFSTHNLKSVCWALGLIVLLYYREVILPTSYNFSQTNRSLILVRFWVHFLITVKETTHNTSGLSSSSAFSITH